MIDASEILIVGTDEAGYGPNLGPLLLGASAWSLRLTQPIRLAKDAFHTNKAVVSVPASPKKTRKKKSVAFDAPSLFDAFDEPRQEFVDVDATFQNAIERLNASLAPISDRKGVFPLVDSKKLFGASKSLAALERPFWLAVDASAGEVLTSASFRSALERVAREDGCAELPPWEREVDYPLPIDPKSGEFNDLREPLATIRALFDSSAIKLVDVAARRVHPSEFNRLLERLGLKSDLIADVTLSTLVETLRRATKGATEPRLCLALCDKLGGRDRYAKILSERFAGADVRIVREARDVSVYRVLASRALDREGATFDFDAPLALEIRFAAKGESNAPTALASIVAKYFRELSMRPFNEYWRREVGETLAPTAGYPVDALRFRAEVDAARARLGIDDEEFWRAK